MAWRAPFRALNRYRYAPPVPAALTNTGLCRRQQCGAVGHQCFHLIRLAAALLVLFAHAFHLLVRAGDEPIGRWMLTMDASLLGVTIFFFISGFLVARSWDARAIPSGFLVARALRIVPALWLAAGARSVLGPAGHDAVDRAYR